MVRLEFSYEAFDNTLVLKNIFKSNKRFFVYPIGIQGSGKSMIRNVILENLENFKCVSPDDIRAKILDSKKTNIWYDPSIEKEVWGEAFSQIKDLTNKGFNIFFDATNTTKLRRESLTQEVNREIFDIVILEISIHPLLAKLRNSKRDHIVSDEIIDRFITQYESPKIREADRIIKIKMKPSKSETIEIWGDK